MGNFVIYNVLLAVTSSMENKSQKRIIPSQLEETRILESSMICRAEMEAQETKTIKFSSNDHVICTSMMAQISCRFKKKLWTNVRMSYSHNIK